jgi:endonuclease YncB( thermonuclease family)
MLSAMLRALLLSLVPAFVSAPQEPALDAAARLVPPLERCEVEEVVDGDTLHVLRGGKLTKLRLLSVDTEEKLSGKGPPSPSKPETVFGHETMLWTRELLRGLAEPGEPPRVGLRFPPGPEELDAYGRLLCHVVLSDGRDLNLLLVECGKSPYFNKYGNSELCHAEFVAAQERARAARIGIWDPRTNAAATPGAPSVKRPYERLLPWWQRRAAAIDRFRALRAEAPEEHVDAEVASELEAAVLRGKPVLVFGTLCELHDEPGGDWTLRFCAPEGAPALRVRIPAERRAAFAGLDLAGTLDEYRQNYVWVRGSLARSREGFALRCTNPADLRVADPH